MISQSRNRDSGHWTRVRNIFIRKTMWSSPFG